MKIFCARPKPDKQLKNMYRWISHVLEKEGYLAEQFKQNQPCTSPSFFWYKKDFLGHPPSSLSSIFFCKEVTNLRLKRVKAGWGPASFYWKLISAIYIPPRYLYLYLLRLSDQVLTANKSQEFPKSGTGKQYPHPPGKTPAQAKSI